MIQFTLINPGKLSVDKQAIAKGVKGAARHLGQGVRGFVSIELVSPEQSRRLNHELRGENIPTDGLSLSPQDQTLGQQIIRVRPDGSLAIGVRKKRDHLGTVIGQLIICPAVVAAQASAAGQSPGRELEWVVEHGILHLAGYHHD